MARLDEIREHYEALSLLKLREADDADDEASEAEKEELEQKLASEESNESPVDAENIVMTDEKYEPVQDGDVPQNAEGITQGSFDALSPNGSISIAFDKGNYPQVEAMPQLVADKTTVITGTFVPLVEKALIELLGSSTMYRRDTANMQLGVNENSEVTISGTLLYIITAWVGLDIDKEAIEHDAKYVMDTIAVAQNVNVTKCEVSTTDGTLVIQFSI
jgi:hypothetical protein